MRQYAETLAREYEVGTTKEKFFDYIIESLINGNRQQVRDLFNEMKGEDQKEFLVDYCSADSSYKQSCKNICISELTNNK